MLIRTVPALLTCRYGSEACLRRLREVLDLVESAADRWPSLESWEQILPFWFVCSFKKPQTQGAAVPNAQPSKPPETLRWTLPLWLACVNPAHPAWSWLDATVQSPNELLVTIAVQGGRAAAGAFDWLARAAEANCQFLCEPPGTDRFSDYVESELLLAGWYPGRHVGRLVDEWTAELSEFRPFPNAQEALLEFGGLWFDYRAGEHPWKRRAFEFDPVNTMYAPQEIVPFSEALSTPICPLGTVIDDDSPDGYPDLIIAEDGKIYGLWARNVYLVGVNIEDAVSSLIYGLRWVRLTR